MFNCTVGYLVALTMLPSLGMPSRTESQDTAKELGQLVRYDGEWIINGDRRSVRVVSHREAHMLQTYESEYRDNFGCPYTRFLSMRMTYDPGKKTYRGQIKWSGDTMKEHFQGSWLPHDLTGRWDSKTKTITWVNESDVNHPIKRLEITTHFPDANQQTTTIYQTVDGRRVQKLFSISYTRLH